LRVVALNFSSARAELKVGATIVFRNGAARDRQRICGQQSKGPFLLDQLRNLVYGQPRFEGMWPGCVANEWAIAAAAGEDGRAIDQARPVRLAGLGGESSDTAVVHRDGSAD
jgi:hypothetical protein